MAIADEDQPFPATMVRIDARGMRCPWPALRAARAIREGAASVAVIADDPIAPGELAALASARGWDCAQSLLPEGPYFLLSPRPARPGAL
ncbi:sulfurtransferase TusA family protein [Sphingobium aquiterrae]|uniref:sulfurtransferase TusA family protein n=1 Tax=Sphingobium aquiterrae TaxID=2038656 RepID=UPI00301753EC